MHIRASKRKKIERKNKSLYSLYIENNYIQRMHLVILIKYINAPTCFGPSDPSSGSVLHYKT